MRVFVACAGGMIGRSLVCLDRAAGGGQDRDDGGGAAGASNVKAKRELGWEPRWPSWREGFRHAPRWAGMIGASPASR